MFYVDIDGKRRRVYKQSDGAFYMYVSKKYKKNVAKKAVYEANPIPKKVKIPAKLAGVMTQNKEFQRTIQELEDKLDKATNDCLKSPEIDAEYKQLIAERNELRSRIEECERDLAQKQEASEESLSELSNCDTALAECNKEINNVRAQLDNFQNLYSSLLDRYRNLEDTKTALDKQLGDSIARILTESDTKNKRVIAECETAIEKIRADYENELRKMRAENVALQENNDAIKEQCNDKCNLKIVEALEQQRDEVEQRRVEALEQQRVEVVEQREALKQQREALEQRVEALEQQRVETLEQQLAEVEDELFYKTG